MSEVGTKLDLARAYMDMGDPEGARSILEEVVQEGSAQPEAGSAAPDRVPARLSDASRPAGCAAHRRRLEYDGTRLRRLAVAGARGLDPGRGRGGARLRRRTRRSRRSAPGRTDAGVHAARPGHPFRHRAERTPRAWVLGANTQLPPDIALQWAGEVAPGFHARHAALRRTYRYCILNRSARSALQRTRAPGSTAPLDAAAMHAAAQALLGEHDFSRVPRGRMPVEDAGAARRAHRGATRAATACGSRSRPTRSCITWCATSSARCSTVQREADPPAAMARDACRPRPARWRAPTAPAAGLYLWRVRVSRRPSAAAIPAPAAAGFG